MSTTTITEISSVIGPVVATNATTVTLDIPVPHNVFLLITSRGPSAATLTLTLVNLGIGQGFTTTLHQDGIQYRMSILRPSSVFGGILSVKLDSTVEGTLALSAVTIRHVDKLCL